MKQTAIDIRDAFFDELYEIASKDNDVIFLTADMGAMSLDKFRKELPEQYINVGIGEQNLMSVAAGLALSGKKVFAYSIVPFATMRCYEQIKIDICAMDLPVTIIGSGGGFTYSSDGPTHHAIKDISVMRSLPELSIFNPSDSNISAALARIAYEKPGPKYIRIDKGTLELLHTESGEDFSAGLAEIKKGRDLTIVSTGAMVHTALRAARELATHEMDAGVIDLYRVHPVNSALLLELIKDTERVITLEENSLTGGIGTAVAEVLTDGGSTTPLKRMALPDAHIFKYGDREWLLSQYGLNAAGVVKIVLEWIKKEPEGEE